MHRCIDCGSDLKFHQRACRFYQPNMYASLLEQEQRKLAKIGGKPCQWTPEQWAKWSMKEDADGPVHHPAA